MLCVEKDGELLWILEGQKKYFTPRVFASRKPLMAPEKFFETVILKVGGAGNYGKMTVWRLFENLKLALARLAYRFVTKSMAAW